MPNNAETIMLNNVEESVQGTEVECESHCRRCKKEIINEKIKCK